MEIIKAIANRLIEEIKLSHLSARFLSDRNQIVSLLRIIRGRVEIIQLLKIFRDPAFRTQKKIQTLIMKSNNKINQERCKFNHKMETL